MSDIAERSYEMMRAALDQKFSVRLVWGQQGPENTGIYSHYLLMLFTQDNGEYLGNVYVQVFEKGGWNIAALCPYLETEKSLRWVRDALDAAGIDRQPFTPPPLEAVPSPGKVATLMRDALEEAQRFVRDAYGRAKENGNDTLTAIAYGVDVEIDTALDAARKVPALFK